MRYEVRYNNQVWHVFDTVQYRAVEAYNNKYQAEARAKQLN